MATCYKCGKRITDKFGRFRRRVKTGEMIRRKYPTISIAQVDTRFGMRIVCDACSRHLDQEDLRRAIKSELIVVGALIIVLVALYIQRYG